MKESCNFYLSLGKNTFKKKFNLRAKQNIIIIKGQLLLNMYFVFELLANMLILVL